MQYSDLFQRLQQNKFRASFRLNAHDSAYLREKGFDEVAKHAHKFIAERLAPAQPKRDGKQTPYRGHPVFVAQHATGTCCRSCLLKWHKMPKGVELSDEQQSHTVDVIMHWLKRQIEPSSIEQ